MSRRLAVVIDDNHLWLDFISRQLQKADFQVMAYSSSAEAIDQIRPQVDLIVVDLLLGYNSVFPLLHELRSDMEVADIPVIVCSSIAAAIPPGSLDNYGVKVVLDKTAMTPADIKIAAKRVLA